MSQLVENSRLNVMTQNEVMYTEILEYSVEAILIHLDNKILYINQSGLNLLKADKEMIIGMDILSVFQEPSKSINQYIVNGIMSKCASDLIEETIFRADGSLVDVEVYSHPVQFGDHDAIQTILRDITKRKETERMLNDREKLVSIGQIAAGIAHEVRNPLTSVKGFLQLLKENHSHPYLNTMEIELEKAIDTLQNLLQVSKPDLYAEPLTKINLSKELSSLMFLFQDKLYNIEVELDLRDSDRFIYGKKNLFLKAFFNLIKNALESMPSKGKIKIEHYYKNESVHVKISDNGVGVPKDKIKLLGTPFYSSKSDGTGLGLTQVFTTINDHGGHIQIQSEVDIGTTFIVQLPVHSDKYK
jgi:two-component system sporulation sensor kinase A